ncbi:MAG: hypothetical protein PHH83_01275 [Patescibacteria group bacterium]|nr:hypothetical protein [Patescibacteria group bacterium]
MKIDFNILLIPSFEWSLWGFGKEIINDALMRSFLEDVHYYTRYLGVNLTTMIPVSIENIKKYLSENKVDLIIVSDNLPEDNEDVYEDYEDEKNLGLKFYKEIIENPEYKNIPFVIQSFSQHDEDVVQLRDIDFYYYVRGMKFEQLYNQFLKKILPENKN